VVKEIVALECTACKERNYMHRLETRGGGKLELSKYCGRCRKHTPHKTRRK
jgi:large subunit ribosomal protein L33